MHSRNTEPFTNKQTKKNLNFQDINWCPDFVKYFKISSSDCEIDSSTYWSGRLLWKPRSVLDFCKILTGQPKIHLIFTPQYFLYKLNYMRQRKFFLLNSFPYLLLSPLTQILPTTLADSFSLCSSAKFIEFWSFEAACLGLMLVSWNSKSVFLYAKIFCLSKTERYHRWHSPQSKTH